MAKTKALISFTITAKLICVFVFACAKSRFSDNEAHLIFANLCHVTKTLFLWFPTSSIQRRCALVFANISVKVDFLRKRLIFSLTISESICGYFILFLAIYVRPQQTVEVISGKSSILTTLFLDRFIT